MKFNLEDYKDKYVMHCKTDGTMYIAKNNDYKVLEWSDYMNKEFTFKDLQVGDFFLSIIDEDDLKRGCPVYNYIVQIDKNDNTVLSINADGEWSKDKFTNDFVCIEKPDYTITAIRRLSELDEDAEYIFLKNKGELLYKYNSIKEMTLEEVCEALGQEIKIVKEH